MEDMTNSSRLVFVDGIPTSGKSTTAHLITLQMRRTGIDADWHYEEEPEDIHPVHVYGNISSSLFCERSLARYRAFATSAARTGRMIVLDGSLFLSSILVLFSRDEIRIEMIKEYAREVIDIVRPLGPWIVYLHRRDVASALDEMARRRSPQWQEWFVNTWTCDKPYAVNRGWKGMDGAVRFWSAYQDLTDELYLEFDVPKIRAETSIDDWNTTLAQIFDFLGLRHLQEPMVPEGELLKYVGIYRDPNDRRHPRHGVENISIWLADGHLYLGGLKWPRMRLIRSTPKRFLVEAITIELEFDFDSSGDAVGFTVAGRNVDGMLGETFVKTKLRGEPATTP